MIELPNDEYALVKPLAWTEVFGIWRANEESRANWIEYWTARGFKSWEEWRTTDIVTPVGLASHEWTLYRVLDPMATVPTFHGGPYRTWIERYYDGKTTPTFAEIVQHPDMEANEGARAIAQNFPQDTTVLGVLTDAGIVIVEGMHRCTAVALAAREGKTITGDFSITVADYRGEKLPPSIGRKTDK